MKFSALILLLLWPMVAIAQTTVAVRVSVTNTGLTAQQVQQFQDFMDAAATKVKYNNRRALVADDQQDKIDTTMVEVKEVEYAPDELPTEPTDPDLNHHSALRGQQNNRELQSCGQLCAGVPPPCRVSCPSGLRQQQLCKSVLTF